MLRRPELDIAQRIAGGKDSQKAIAIDQLGETIREGDQPEHQEFVQAERSAQPSLQEQRGVPDQPPDGAANRQTDGHCPYEIPAQPAPESERSVRPQMEE